jgi:hypothetical protein
MKFGLILTIVLMSLAVTAFGQNWECRNDLEIRCGAGNCAAETAGGFTPMDINFDETGKMSVCAYTGCWEGTGKVFRDGDFVMLAGRNMKFSTAADMNRNIAITLDTKDDVAFVKAGDFAQPLLCKKSGGAAAVDTPEFGDYKVKVSTAQPKPIKFAGNKDARMFRTRLTEARNEGVNFAGHFIFASWGCGTSCLQGAIIDASTGEVFFPEELSVMSFGMGGDEIPDEPLQFRKDSKLFILHGYTGGDSDEPEGGVHYLVWEGKKFKRVKYVPFENETR